MEMTFEQATGGIRAYALEEGKKEGIQIGEKRGEKRGKLEKQMEIVKNMLQKKYSKESIMEITNVTEEIIKSCEKELKKI